MLAIVVDNAANEFVYPQTADFTFYGGIYRDVNVISVNETHFDLEYWGGNGLKITPIMKDGNAEVVIEVFAKTLRGKLWFAGLFLTLAKKQSGGNATPKQKDKDTKKKKKSKTPEMSSGLMDMIGGFTVLRFTGMLAMRNVTFTKEELLAINRKLNKIRKPR